MKHIFTHVNCKDTVETNKIDTQKINKNDQYKQHGPTTGFPNNKKNDVIENAL